MENEPRNTRQKAAGEGVERGRDFVGSVRRRVRHRPERDQGSDGGGVQPEGRGLDRCQLLDQKAYPLVAVEAELADAAAWMKANRFNPTIGKHIDDLTTRKKELAEQLADARHRAAHPLSESWGECQSLVDTLAAAPDPRDARLRLRSALRRIVDDVWLLIVPRGHDRLAAVQIRFPDKGKVRYERSRNLCILYRPPTAVDGHFWYWKQDGHGDLWVPPLHRYQTALEDETDQDMQARQAALPALLDRLATCDFLAAFGEATLRGEGVIPARHPA